ncbi:MAG: DUF4097 family beta strand repeat-containing protein [Thermomicrobiales bacterium]
MTTEREMGQTGFAMYDDDGGEHRIPLAQTSGPIELDVSNSSGEISVRAGAGPDAVVRFQKVGGRGNDSQLHIEVNDSRIKIEPRGEGGLGGLLKRNHGSFDIDVELPRERLADGSARVRVRTASGEVEIEEVPGEIRVNTASGDARVSSADGDITVQTASGDVALIRPRGQVTAHTASGDIHVEHAVLSRFAIATASGDTRLTGKLNGNEASKVEGVSGDVWLQLAASAIEELRYATVSGDASIEGALQKVAPRTWRMGESGGPTISVKTVSGDLHIEGIHVTGETEPIRGAVSGGDTVPFSTIPTPPTAPAPPSPPAPPDAPMPVTGEPDGPADEAASIAAEAAHEPIDEAERLEVLQALERGEIDIEEALSRLGDPDEPTGA